MRGIEQAAKAINEQKGASIAMQALVLSIFRALTLEQQARALEEFDKDREIALTMLLNAEAPEDVLSGFDQQIAAINKLRMFPPKE